MLLSTGIVNILVMIRRLFNSLSATKRGFSLLTTRPTEHSTKFFPPICSNSPSRSLTHSSVSHAGKSTGHTQTQPQPLKEFKDMPGPWKVPLLEISPEMLLTDRKKSIQMLSKMPQKYGNIFKVKVIPGLPELVYIFDPEDSKTLFRSESKYPERMPLKIWEDARKAYGKPLGLFFL